MLLAHMVRNATFCAIFVKIMNALDSRLAVVGVRRKKKIPVS